MRARGRLARQWLLRCLHWLLGLVFLQPLGLQQASSSPGIGAAGFGAAGVDLEAAAGISGEAMFYVLWRDSQRIAVLYLCFVLLGFMSGFAMFWRARRGGAEVGSRGYVDTCLGVIGKSELLSSSPVRTRSPISTARTTITKGQHPSQPHTFLRP